MNMKEVVPFLAVQDMKQSLAFYKDGLGFEVKHHWVDDGITRWCRLQLGGAGLMLQQFRTEGHDARTFSSTKGGGITLCFFCDDAVAFFRTVTAHGLSASEPVVGNGLWVTSLKDPDGYALDFQSPTDVKEETRLSEIEMRSEEGPNRE